MTGLEHTCCVFQRRVCTAVSLISSRGTWGITLRSGVLESKGWTLSIHWDTELEPWKHGRRNSHSFLLPELFHIQDQHAKHIWWKDTIYFFNLMWHSYVKLFYSIERVQAFLLLLLIWYNNGAHLIYIWLCISSLVLILEGLLIVDLFTAVSLN